MESWYTKLFSMTLVKVKMHLEGLNGWNEIVKPKKLKVIVWQRKLESHLTFFSKPNKTCNYQYCKWWLYIISNQPQQPAVQINLILATHFGDGTDLRRSPHLCFNLQEGGEEDEDVDASPRFLCRQIFNFAFFFLSFCSIHWKLYNSIEHGKICKKVNAISPAR